MGGGGKPKVIALHLTDGKRDALAVDFKAVPKLAGMDTPPGTKVWSRVLCFSRARYDV